VASAARARWKLPFVVGTFGLPKRAQYSLRADFKKKDKEPGFFSTDDASVDINRVHLCAECGFAAFFATQKFDTDAVVPQD
jgi:hypothetical protein